MLVHFDTDRIGTPLTRLEMYDIERQVLYLLYIRREANVGPWTVIQVLNGRALFVDIVRNGVTLHREPRHEVMGLLSRLLHFIQTEPRIASL